MHVIYIRHRMDGWMEVRCSGWLGVTEVEGSGGGGVALVRFGAAESDTTRPDFVPPTAVRFWRGSGN